MFLTIWVRTASNPYYVTSQYCNDYMKSDNYMSECCSLSTLCVLENVRQNQSYNKIYYRLVSLSLFYLITLAKAVKYQSLLGKDIYFHRGKWSDIYAYQRATAANNSTWMFR